MADIHNPLKRRRDDTVDLHQADVVSNNPYENDYQRILRRIWTW